MRQFLTVALKDDLHVSNISSSEVDSLYLKTNKQYRRLLQSSSFTSPDTSKEHWQLCSLNGPSVSLKKITANVRTRKAVVILQVSAKLKQCSHSRLFLTFWQLITPGGASR